MNILFIWDGAKPLPESRKKAVESALAMYPDAVIQCITRLRHFVSERIKCLSWELIQCSMQRFLGLKNVPYGWNDPMCFSDWARFYWLGLHPGTLYLDTDVTLLKPYAFDDESKAIYSAGNICLLYSPRSYMREYFLNLIYAQAKKAIGLLIGLVNQFTSEWSKPAPADCFRHK